MIFAGGKQKRCHCAAGAILGALLLSGCMVGPKYERPAVDVPDNWRWKKAALQDAARNGMWWQAFHDPKLDELESLALEANQDIQAGIARVDEARAAARLNRADFFPQISVKPAFNRSELSGNTFLPVNTTGHIPGLRRPHNFFSMPLDLSYEIDAWGRVRRSVNAANERAEASVAEYHTVLLTVSADVAVNYFLLHALDAENDVLERTLALRKQSLELAGSQFKFGATDALDVERAKTDVASNLAAIADVKRQREETLNVLAILCGKPASKFGVEVKPLAVEPPEIPAGLPSALLERRPDVVRAERTLEAANEEIGVAKTNFYPRFSLTSYGGFESQELSKLFNWPSTIWQIATNMAQPVFTGGKNKAQLEAAQARYDQAQAAYRQQVLVAFKDVEDALTDIRFRAEQASALNDAVLSAREVTKLATVRYENGKVGYLDVIDATRSQLLLEQQGTQVLGQRLTAAVRLIKALGGGWDTESPAEPKAQAVELPAPEDTATQ